MERLLFKAVNIFKAANINNRVAFIKPLSSILL